jgi:hypothetical protein
VEELNEAITAAVQQLEQPLQLFMQAAQAAQQVWLLEGEGGSASVC